MLYIVEGKTPDHHDRTLRVEAESSAQAEAIGWARGIFVAKVTVVEKTDLLVNTWQRVSSGLRIAWRRITPATMRVFGRPVSAAQGFALLVSGMATWALDLHAFHFV